MGLGTGWSGDLDVGLERGVGQCPFGTGSGTRGSEVGVCVRR